MNRRFAHVALVLAALCGAGCQRDQRGISTVVVQTTLPEGIEVTLANADRWGVYADRAVADFDGTLRFIGVRPGRYKMIFQFVRPDFIPSHPAYNYGQSDVFEVTSGTNRFEWTPGTGAVHHRD